MTADSQQGLPLEGMVVVDLSRMLPGAVLARQLLDLGARLLKVEEPGTGDPMRLVPPMVGGVGVGFAAMLRGAESLGLDLRDPADAERVRALVGRAVRSIAEPHCHRPHGTICQADWRWTAPFRLGPRDRTSQVGSRHPFRRDTKSNTGRRESFRDWLDLPPVDLRL